MGVRSRFLRRGAWAGAAEMEVAVVLACLLNAWGSLARYNKSTGGALMGQRHRELGRQGRRDGKVTCCP